MPLINVYLRQGTTPEYRRNVSAALHKAMIDVLKIPHDDQFHVFHEVTPDNFHMQPVVFGLPRSGRTMFIQLSFNQRTAEQKSELFRGSSTTSDCSPMSPKRTSCWWSSKQPARTGGPPTVSSTLKPATTRA